VSLVGRAPRAHADAGTSGTESNYFWKIQALYEIANSSNGCATLHTAEFQPLSQQRQIG